MDKGVEIRERRERNEGERAHIIVNIFFARKIHIIVVSGEYSLILNNHRGMQTIYISWEVISMGRGCDSFCSGLTSYLV